MRVFWWIFLFGCDGTVLFGDGNGKETDTAAPVVTTSSSSTTMTSPTTSKTSTTPTGTTSPAPPDPFRPGPFAVSAQSLDVPLGDRGDGFPSVVEMTLYLPIATPERVPVVLFSHGFSISPDQYLSTGEHLASHGLAVAMPTWDEGFLFTRTHTGLASDVVAFLDWLEGAASSDADLNAILDTDRIGLSGHSRGGKQSIQAALTDDRVLAIFGVDPVDAAPPLGGSLADYPSMTPEHIGDLAIPAAYIGAGRGGDGFVACAPVDNNYQQYYDFSTTPAWLYTFPNAGHSDFIDNCADSPSLITCGTCTIGDDPAAYRDLSRTLQVAFFRLHLSGEESYRPWVDSPEDFIESVEISVAKR
jgi:predicted dienelactone hydrolase